MNPIPQLLGCLVVFLGLVFGLGLPPVAAWRLTPPEKICAGAAVGVVLLYLFALVHYWLNLPAGAFGLVPLAALILLALRRRPCAAVLRDPAARRLLGAFLLVAGWTLGFLALVRSYSGGRWALDWAEHYDRALLFLHHQPADWRLIGGAPLAARPPLANAVTAVFLAVTSADFPFFQIFTTLASSLALLPVWLWTGRFSRNPPRAQAWLTVLFMLNPSVMENLTFAWTKLITVFFVLTGVYFFLPALAAGSRRRLAAAFVFLAAGLLAHYSAGPYVVAIVTAYFWARRADWRRRAFWIDTVLCALPAALLLATWFAWSLREFGAAGTFLSNTAVTGTTVRSWAGLLHQTAVNLQNTLVPHPFRSVDHGPITQLSRLGYLRDYFFLLYQVNLPLLFGSIGGPTLLWLLWRGWRSPRGAPDQPPRAFWLWFVGCTVVLGVAAVPIAIDDWGVAQSCLQSLLGLGLACLAARMETVPRWWRSVFCMGLTVDFVLGVGLQFYLENLSHPLSEAMRDNTNYLLLQYGVGQAGNLWIKLRHGYDFVGDWPIQRPALVMLLACLLLLAVYRCASKSEKTVGDVSGSAAPGGELPI